MTNYELRLKGDKAIREMQEAQNQIINARIDHLRLQPMKRPRYRPNWPLIALAVFWIVLVTLLWRWWFR